MAEITPRQALGMLRAIGGYRDWMTADWLRELKGEIEEAARKGEISPLKSDLSHLDRLIAQAWPSKPAATYLMRSITGEFKIGVSINPAKRRSEIQSSEQCRVTLMSEIWFQSESEAYALESELHSHFKDKVTRRKEWFRLERADVEYIEGLAATGVQHGNPQ